MSDVIMCACCSSLFMFTEHNVSHLVVGSVKVYLESESRSIVKCIY